MNLHTNAPLFRDSILATSEFLEMREVYIEKDYWVTLTLKEIFNSAVADRVVFKGGTALSKCFKAIERFSEDIDLVVLQEEGESGNRIRNRLRNVTRVVASVLPEEEIEGITNKMGNIRKTAHIYERAFKGELGQVRGRIIVEASSLGNFEPAQSMKISSYIYEMMISKDQEKIAREYELEPFQVRVLTKDRTLCEKIMSLVRFSRTEAPIEDLRNKVRHIYDIHQLLKDPEVLSFFGSNKFEELLNQVGIDDFEGYRNNNHWIPEHPSKAIIFAKSKDTWKDLEGVYNGEFKGLVTGELPARDQINKTLEMVFERLKGISWNMEDA